MYILAKMTWFVGSMLGKGIKFIVGRLDAYRDWNLGQRTRRTENGSVRNPGGGNVKRLYLDKNFVDIFYCNYVTAKKCEHML